jgi:hypothetical protein
MTQNHTSQAVERMVRTILTLDEELAVQTKYQRMEEALWKVLQQEDDPLVIAHIALSFDPLSDAQ